MKILLFIPMYNCEKQIVSVVDQLAGEISKYIDGVIIVNNRSTDDGENNAIMHLQTKQFSFPVCVLRNRQNYGLGGSHKVAFQFAIDNGYDYIIVLHGDDQGRIADFLPLLKTHEYEKYDCCLGARFMKGSQLKGIQDFVLQVILDSTFFFQLLYTNRLKTWDRV